MSDTPPNLFPDFATWTADSVVTLTNVPWNNDYRDVVMFPSTNALNEYIDKRTSRVVDFRKARYVKVDQPIKLDIPFAAGSQFNYVRVFNPAQPVDARVGGLDVPMYYYYFITSVTHESPNTTTVTVQLDIWQTYIRRIRFGRCYLEQGHMGIANQDNFRSYGRDFLTVPEGLDTGSDYVTITRKADDRVIAPVQGNYSILVAASVQLEYPPGTIKNPNFRSAEGSMFQSLPSGASYYVFQTSAEFMAFMKAYADKPWVTENIMSITVIPPIERYFPLGSLGAKLSIGAYRAPVSQAYKDDKPFFLNWRNSSEIINYIPPAYRHLKKFFTFPYMAIRVTTQTGQVVILKPEAWNSKDARVKEQVSLLPPNQRIIWWPREYNSRVDAEQSIHSEDRGQGLDNAVGITSFPTLAIVNNGAISYLAANAHSISYGAQSAEWAQQKAMRAAQTGYDQATAGINASTALNENALNTQRQNLNISNQLSGQQAIMGSLNGAGTGLIGGAVAGGGPGALVGTAAGLTAGVLGNVGNLMQQDANNRSYAASAAGSRAANSIAGGNAAYVRDTNRDVAQWAARGDYENEIRGQQARLRDAQLTPPSIAGQVGGEALNILNFQSGVFIDWMMPDQASIKAIGDFWLRYGYAINRFTRIPNDLMVMEKFTYWKMKETYIVEGNMPESFKQGIRGIMEKGVTVYRAPEYIGQIDLYDNKPLPGIVIEGYDPGNIDPEPPINPPTEKKKRKHKMIVLSANDTNPASPGPVYALAGASPGTQANFWETRDPVKLQEFMAACNVESTIGVTIEEFYIQKGKFLAPLTVDVLDGGEGTPE